MSGQMRGSPTGHLRCSARRDCIFDIRCRVHLMYGSEPCDKKHGCAQILGPMSVTDSDSTSVHIRGLISVRSCTTRARSKGVSGDPISDVTVNNVVSRYCLCSLVYVHQSWLRKVKAAGRQVGRLFLGCSCVVSREVQVRRLFWENDFQICLRIQLFSARQWIHVRAQSTEALWFSRIFCVKGDFGSLSRG